MDNRLLDALSAVGQAVSREKDFLTSLDAAIGDGDHGINMARGFEAVQAKMATLAPEADVAAILKLVGMTLISTVGGASGPLYGTAFLRMSAALQGVAEVDAFAAGKGFEAAIMGIKERGKAATGEKTMLDALVPAYDAYTQAVQEGKKGEAALEAACLAAQAGVEYTKTIAATKGRASYLGDRSIGHQDPGATSSTLMLTTLLLFLRGQDDVR